MTEEARLPLNRPFALRGAPRVAPPPADRHAWLRKLVTGAVWLALGVSLAYWGLRWWGHTPPVTLPVAAHPSVSVDVATVARALGQGSVAGETVVAPPIAVVPRTQAVLTGVATDARGQGVALVSMAGQPPVPVRVGAALPDGWVLHKLSREEAVLSAPPGQVGETRLPLVAAPPAR
jgi:general secretion pathway protein C